MGKPEVMQKVATKKHRKLNRSLLALAASHHPRHPLLPSNSRPRRCHWIFPSGSVSVIPAPFQEAPSQFTLKSASKTTLPCVCVHELRIHRAPKSWRVAVFPIFVPERPGARVINSEPLQSPAPKSRSGGGHQAVEFLSEFRSPTRFVDLFDVTCRSGTGAV